MRSQRHLGAILGRSKVQEVICWSHADDFGSMLDAQINQASIKIGFFFSIKSWEGTSVGFWMYLGDNFGAAFNKKCDFE